MYRPGSGLEKPLTSQGIPKSKHVVKSTNPSGPPYEPNWLQTSGQLSPLTSVSPSFRNPPSRQGGPHIGTAAAAVNDGTGAPVWVSQHLRSTQGIRHHKDLRPPLAMNLSGLVDSLAVVSVGIYGTDLPSGWGLDCKGKPNKTAVEEAPIRPPAFPPASSCKTWQKQALVVYLSSSVVFRPPPGDRAWQQPKGADFACPEVRRTPATPRSRHLRDPNEPVTQVRSPSNQGHLASENCLNIGGPYIPNTPWDCQYMPISWGGLGVNVGIYGIHGASGYT